VEAAALCSRAVTIASSVTSGEGGTNVSIEAGLASCSAGGVLPVAALEAGAQMSNGSFQASPPEVVGRDCDERGLRRASSNVMDVVDVVVVLRVVVEVVSV